MAYSVFPNVSLKGIAACVPKASIEIRSLEIFTEEEAEKFIGSTGVEHRRVAGHDICTSDLCFQAAERLITDLKWRKQEIDCLVFVTQTPDYDLPATSCILQNRLGLNSEIVTIDISSGCSGWVYGLYVMSAMLASGNQKKGLLLVGDTILKTCSKDDKSTFPLFGDAGTATALEFEKGEEGIKFHIACDGSGFETIIIPDGGYRNIASPYSFESIESEPGIKRNNMQLSMDGMNVFSFGITKAPESVNLLLSHFNISRDKVDHYIFHQANMFLNEKIRKKLNLNIDKVPYTLRDFGNTSSASIPLTICLNLGGDLSETPKSIIACGFGVGLSWGSAFFKVKKLICSELVEI